MGEDVVVWTDKVGPYNNPQDRVYSQKQFSDGVCNLCITIPGAVVHIQAIARTAIQLAVPNAVTQETYEYSTLGLCELEGCWHVVASDASYQLNPSTRNKDQSIAFSWNHGFKAKTLL